MRKHRLLLSILASGLAAFALAAQPGQPPTPGLDGAMAKLFGPNTGFSAGMEFHSMRQQGGEVVVPGRIYFLDGKSRFDMDMANMQGGQVPPQAATRMKQMGMSRISAISVPDKNQAYMVYPDLKAYMESPGRGAASGAGTDFKMETTRLGEESVDGHPCIKNKVTLTGGDGSSHASIVWNASDLNQFPLKIQAESGNGADSVLVFKDVKLTKPEASQFEVPTDYTKYADMMSLVMSAARGNHSQ